jgi:peroxiredoxin Q/BCP
MRDSHGDFEKAGVVVVAVSQDDAEDVAEYWSENGLPFVGIPDPDGKLKTLYDQQSRMGPLPALFVVDREGILVLVHYGDGMADIPKPAALLEIATKK